MAAKATHAPQHRKVGAALGYLSEVIDIDMRCTACGTLQTAPLDADQLISVQIAEETCLWCGRCGTMARAPR